MTASELRQRRQELGYSVGVLAEVLGVDAAMLKAWECGDEVIPDSAFLDIAFLALIRTRRSEWPSLLRDDSFPV